MFIRVTFGFALILGVAASAQAADIHNAVSANDLPRVKRIIEKDAKQVDAQQQGTNYSPLHVAVIGNRLDIAKYLLSKKANVNLQDRYKRTPLWFAVNYSRTELTQLLLQHKADPNIKDQSEMAPLWLALYTPQNNHAELLLNAGADPNTMRRGQSAFHTACNSNRTKEALLML